jgi:hypothetical protein
MWETVLSRLLNDPVSVYLLAGDILATIAIGFGIIWEHGPPDVRVIANRLVIGGVAIETLCSALLFAYDANTIGAQNEKIIAMEARPWTKAQFDAIQELKGKVTDVGVIAEKGCIECGLFADHIELALHAAGVQLYGDDNLDWVRGTGIHVSLPIGLDLFNDPLVKALRDAGLNPGALHHNPPEWSPVRTDIRVIFVGEKFPLFSSFPYFPTGASQWTILPLKNPSFIPPNPTNNAPTNHMHFQVSPKP